MTERGAKAVSLPPVDATPEEIAQALFPPRPTGQAARSKVDATKRVVPVLPRGRKFRLRVRSNPTTHETTRHRNYHTC